MNMKTENLIIHNMVQQQKQVLMNIQDYIQYIPKAISIEYEDNIYKEIKFPEKRLKCKVFGKIYDVPRDQAFFHFDDKKMIYRFSGMSLESQPASPILYTIRKWIYENIEATKNGKYDVVLINRYLSGKDKVGWHSDDDGNNDSNFPIISISFGDNRKFQVRPKKGDERPITTFNLSSGDVIVMKPNCQLHFVHQVPITTKKVGQRINLTFRSLI
jgi:alkylated DNA repair dioxygenase AlkB